MARETGHTGYFLCEGGAVIEMDLPLPEAIAGRVAKGYIRRVNPDGSPPPAPQPPAPSAVKAEWVGYAVRVHDADPDEAEAMTKPDLIEKYGPQSE